MQKWTHYLAANPDLINVGITTQNEVEKHYFNCGRREGRTTYFKWQHYLAANPDLIKWGIATEEEVMDHFIQNGFKENRPAVFDWCKYLEVNPTLGLNDEKEALEHYILQGFHQGLSVKPKFNLHHPKLTVAFVAHTMEIVLNLNRSYIRPHILFVGNKPFYPTPNPNVVIVRELPDHIEDKWRLLTFTAWYAVVKNNLYPGAEYLCLLEYDARVESETFSKQVFEAAGKADLVGFLIDHLHFFSDIQPQVLAAYLKTKHIDPALYPSLYKWISTTNLCARRSFFKDFVDWYNYEFFVEHDDYNLPYYHERLVTVFADNLKYTTLCVENVLKHEQLNSHSAVNSVMVLYDDGSHRMALNKLVKSISIHSPTLRVSYVKKPEMDADFVAANARILQTPRGGGLWLWKPYCILLMLNSVKDGETVIYLDSKYVFVAPVDKLFQNRDLLVWKNKPTEPSYSHVAYCKRSVLTKYSSRDGEQSWAGLLVVRKSKQTVAILREWLEMCCVYEDISDENTGPNHPEFIDHRHDQSLLSIVLAKHGVPLLTLDDTILQKQ